MKEIILYNSSSRGTELKDFSKATVEGGFTDLQIITKIKNLLGENLPGIKFEAAKVQFGYFKRRRIKKTASQDLNSWAEFIPIDDDENYLLLVPSVKFVDDEIEELSKDEILAYLCQAENYAAEHPRETEKRMKKIEKKNRKERKKKKDNEEKSDSDSSEESEEQNQKEENSESNNKKLEK